ncbi:MAG TPA: symmetrical bis(5'-nucleosyl)-tetraphosphatase [Nevskiaceae bacterium]|nr:symmetrical bis(5'-nucleosyl)-tetraphosphatase [Nevskiaceae bacterium]
MATYAIGDVQGCLAPLQQLLDRLKFDPGTDHLWFTGDLVNRGPDSLGSLRFIRSLGDAAVTVLGNHDLHLLAIAYGVRKPRHDNLDDVLNAPDRAELLDWLATRPLLIHDPEHDWTLLHAGLPPEWDLPTARDCAGEAEEWLRGPQRQHFLTTMYGDMPDRWNPATTGDARHRFTVNCLTRMRYCMPDGRLLFEPKGPPGTQPDGALPWFALPGRKSAGHRIVFGHWASLGQVHWPAAQVWNVDTGCVWGRSLSALCLETGVVTSCGCSA